MQVIVIGPVDTPVFAEIGQTIRDAVPVNRLHSLPHIKDDNRFAGADLIVVLQQRPDEYTRNEVLTLFDAAPLARFMVCFGPWCDSEGRTRDVWPHVIRIPVAAAHARIALELDSMQHHQPPLPLTADRNEIALHQSACDLPHHAAEHPLTVAVLSADASVQEWVRDVLSAAGHNATCSGITRMGSSVDLVVWDADPWNDQSCAELRFLKENHRDVPVAALCGFPRVHLLRELTAAGASLVIPKPVAMHELVSRVSLIASRNASRSRS